MGHAFVDVQGLAGAWTLGTVQAGFELISRATLGRTPKKAGFGDVVIDANRHLVGDGWTQQEGGDLSEWEPLGEKYGTKAVAYVCGTPPCSGFSLLNNSAAAARKRGGPAPATARGPESSINDCMKALVRYGGTKCYGRDGKRGADVIAFESVQGAFKQGRSLMQYMLETLRADTGLDYNLTHVLMSGASVGAPQMRHRYYFVAHRIPFGVDAPEERTVATYGDALGDLVARPTTWDRQPYGKYASDWITEQNMYDPAGTFTDHFSINDEKDMLDALPARFGMMFNTDPARGLISHWQEGYSLEQALRAYMDANGGRSPAVLAKLGVDPERWYDFKTDHRNGFGGIFRTKRWHPGYVLTGGCLADQIHYENDRLLTVREGARMMGYPDTWQWREAVNQKVMQAGILIGKCCPVQSGRWISTWIDRALEGNPGKQGNRIGAHEFLHDSTGAYKRWKVGYTDYE
jgi:site-specific DNA-cytosine methylase